MDSATLKETISTLLPNGLGARGDQEANPVLYPNRPLHVLLATSGSVASIKAPLIVAAFRKVRSRLFSHPMRSQEGDDVAPVLTEHSFATGPDFRPSLVRKCGRAGHLNQISPSLLRPHSD
jgi:hypothetical protein